MRGKPEERSGVSSYRSRIRMAVSPALVTKRSGRKGVKSRQRSPHRSLLPIILLLLLISSSLSFPFVRAQWGGGYTGEHWDTGASGCGEPFGMTTDGTYIWITDWTDDEVYKYQMDGTYIDSWDTSVQSDDGYGIATDGTNIWILDFLLKEVYKYDMDGDYTTEHWDTSGQGTDPTCITTDGNYLWIVDFFSNEVYRYHMNGTYTGAHWSVLDQGIEPYGITTDGNYIWVLQFFDKKVDRYSMSGSYISSLDVSGQCGSPQGIATDGLFLWVSDNINDEVYKYKDRGVIPQNLDSFNWVFVSNKRYSFKFIIGSQLLGNSTVGFAFQDGINDWYRILYNFTSETLSVEAPQDSIDVELKSVERGEYLSEAYFDVRFHSAIVDVVNTILYERTILLGGSDTDWVESGFIFNIYSVGGAYELSKSGWAGRTVGGQEFEIYAADTRAPILVSEEDFNVREVPLPTGRPAGWWGLTPEIFPEPEEPLLEELVDWKVYLSNRDENHTIYPTSRLPTGSPAGARTYNSYPFGLRIFHKPYAYDRFVFIEKQFRREVTTTDSENVTAQVFAMVPSSTGAAGTIMVTDNGMYGYFTEGAPGYASAAYINFDGLGNLTANDDGVWVHLIDYAAWTWYNITMVLNVAAQTYSVYVDDVLKAEDMDFSGGATSVEHIGFYTHGTGEIYTDMYIDDVEVRSDWEGDYAGVVTASSTYHNLQHFAMFFGYGIEGAGGLDPGVIDEGYIEFGWDTLQDEWKTPQLKVRISPVESALDKLDNWVKFNVSWYSNTTLLKSDILYSFYQGDMSLSTSSVQREMCTFRLDTWVSKEDYGAYIGGRISAEYFGMSANSPRWSNLWNLFGKDWGPKTTDVTQSMFSMKISNYSGSPILAREIVLTKVWAKVYRSQVGTSHHRIRDIDEFTMTTSPDVMVGIDTPGFTDAVIPNMKSGHFAEPLQRFFTNLGKNIWGGLGWLSIQFTNVLLGIQVYIVEQIMDLFPFLSMSWDEFVVFLSGLPLIDTFLSNAITWFTSVWSMAVVRMTQVVAMLLSWGTLVWTLLTWPFTLIAETYNTIMLIWTDYEMGDLMQFGVLFAFIELLREGVDDNNWTPMLSTIKVIWGIITWPIKMAIDLLKMLPFIG